MDNFVFIEFQRQRDFGRKVNATFEFVKQNFGSLFKSLLFIAGPPVLLGSLLLGSFFGKLMGLSSMAATDPLATQAFFASGEFWIKMLLMMVFLLISGVITIATINNYLLLYAERKTNKIEVGEVWQRVRETFWMYFFTTLLFAVLALAAYILLIIPMAVFTAISAFLVFLGILGFIAVFIYLLISASLIYIIRAWERIGFFEALTRSFKLVRNKWWSTFGIILILYLIMGIISYIPLIPMYVVMFANSLHNADPASFDAPSLSWEMWTTVFFTLYYLIQMFLNTLPQIGIAFQYFNLVELKEAKGLLTDINTLGQAPPTNRPEDQF